MTQVLLIDDDARLAELLTRYFERFQIKLTSALRPSDGLRLLRETRFDLVILDVMLPEQDGFDVCREIRKTSQIPIIMLTARGEVTDRIVGLELGADDYLAKPFEPRELVARVQNILKRMARPRETLAMLRFEHLEIDTDLRSVRVDGALTDLSASEYQLLTLLAGQPQKTFTRDEILNALKGVEAELFTRSVDILVSRLRRALLPHDFIKTVRGTGYCFAGKPL